MAVRTLVARCPDWPVIAVPGSTPDEPIAVVCANRVVAASPAARAQGVRPGQRRREAQARCPSLEIVGAVGSDTGYSAEHEARAFGAVVRALDDVTPLIELQRPGVCAFATRGPSRYFGGDEVLAEAVHARVDAVLAEMGWPGHVDVGVADGPFTALLAAGGDDVCRNGVRVVPCDDTVDFLAVHPVGVLTLAGLPPELPDVLTRLGLTTLGAFAALDAGDVVARFGAHGRRAHRLARGLDEFPPAVVTPPPELSVTNLIDPPVERVDQATFVAKVLADELHERLERRGLACTRVCIVAETEHGERLERLWRHEGTLGPAAIVERVRWQLDGWLTGSAATRPTAGVSSISLIPDQVTAAHGHQIGLWGGRGEADTRATRAMARVQGMLSHEAVLVPRHGGGRGVAESIVLVPFVAEGSDVDVPRDPVAFGDSIGVTGLARAKGRAPWPGRLPAPPPARVSTHASDSASACVSLVDAVGASVRVNGRGMLETEPVRIAVDGGPWCPIEAWSAPWLLDERWWDPVRHRRRARMQIVAGGTAYILSLERGRWRVEATYD